MTKNLPAPLDVKLMNMTASALFVAFAFMVVGALVGWVARYPAFAISGIAVTGEVTHNNAITLRANVAPRLSGTFFTLDLTAARQAFEAVPWVRRAVVRREFPNRLKVQLQDTRPWLIGARRANPGWSTALVKCLKPMWVRWSKTLCRA